MKVREQLAKISSLRDLQVVQAQDYPRSTSRWTARAGQSEVTPADVAKAMVAATSLQPFRRAELSGSIRRSESAIRLQVEVSARSDRIRRRRSA